MMFGVGSVLATTFRVYGRNLPRFFLLTVLAYVPIVGFSFLLEIDAVQELVAKLYNWFARLHPALRYDAPSGSWIPIAMLAAAIAVCTVGTMRDQRTSIWRGAATAFRRIHWIVITAFLVRLSTEGVSTVVQIALWDDETRFYRAFSLTAYVAYAALWIVLGTIFLVAIPAVALERRGPFSALARAWTLARGERLKVLAIVLVHYVLVVGLYYGLYFAMMSDPGDVSNIEDRFLYYGFARLALEVFLAPLHAVLVAVVFERLRAAKEGPGEDQLQRVFD